MSITPREPADFTPSRGNYTELKPFRFWCQKVLPLVYDDSLSYYELLCKVVDYLNKTMEDVDTLEGDVTALHSAYVQLQEYVNGYFNSLDVQEEINNKLDTMAEDGTLSNILSTIVLENMPPLVVDNVNEMTDINRLYILKTNSHIYQYKNNNFIDTGIVFGETIGNVVTWTGLISTETDLNDLESQTIGLLNYGANLYPNKPTDSIAYVYTIGGTGTLSKMQIYFDQETKNVYIRFRVGTTWSNWTTNAYDVKWVSLIESGTDLNDLESQTIGLLNYGTDLYPNKPTDNSAYIYTIGGTGSLSKMQIYFDQETKDVYTRFRVGNTWGNWSTNPNDVKWVSLIASGTDLNDLESQTIGLLNYGTNLYPNKPTDNSAYIYTIGGTGSLSKMQIYFDQETKNVYIRFRIGGVWSNWSTNAYDVKWISLIESGTDLNDLESQTIGLLNYGTNLYTNKPTDNSAYIYTIGGTGPLSKMQIYIDQETKEVYTRFRVGSTWGNWSTNPNDVKWVSLIASGTDLNDLESQTIGLLNYGTNLYPNKPTDNSAYIYTIGGTGSLSKMQIYFDQETKNVYIRFRIGGVWSNWSTNAYDVKWVSLINNGTDLNNLESQTIGLLNYGANLYQNKPTDNVAYIYTIGGTGSLSKMQIYFDQETKETYIRFRTGSTWSNWSTNPNDVKWVSLIASGTDLNDLESQTIGLLNYGENLYPNKPTSNIAYIYTIGGTGSLSKMQIYFDQETKDVYVRFRAGTTWRNWLAYLDGNPNAKMYSIGNSILTGSVWLNGVYNHLSGYYNSPYGIIADSIRVQRNNETHRLISSTGLLYDAGNGNFLNNIKAIDLSNYDVLLTHLWTADMDNFQLGDENSTPNDGTIVGGVLELLNYMKTSNSLCQLVLVSVPPVSTVNYGNNVFTGNFNNGKSINDLDTIMKVIAKTHHFTYVDWQDLNLSYYYHDYTDGMNVHANNENTYRIMGSYIGSRVSSKISF